STATSLACRGASERSCFMHAKTASAPAGDEGAGGGPLDRRAVGLVCRVVGAHGGKALLKGLQLGLGAAGIDLIGTDRFLDEHADAIIAHLGESLADGVPVLGAADDVHQLAGREGSDQRCMPRAE